jgi:hypothetical protein
LGLAVAALLIDAPGIAAQRQAVAAGRVVRVRGTDTLDVARAQVTLHRVARARQGPIDSAIAGPRGEFRFRFVPDTTAIYLLSSGYAGIEYFSTPLHAVPAAPDTGLLLIVSDTSSTVPLRVTSRHIVISRPQKDGTRPALEIVVLENDGTDTRVATQGRASWSGRVPKGVLNFQVGSGDVSGDAMTLRNDSVLLLAPVAPGEKQLLYTYQIPPGPGKVQIPLGDSIATVNVLLEEFDRTVSGGEIAKADSQTIEGRSFRQWAGPAPAGSVVTIDFPKNRVNWMLPVLVGAVAVSLLFIALRAMKQATAAPPSGATNPVLDELARLDASYAGREAEVAPAEWAAYQEQRARLKQELAAQLAGRKAMS